MPYTKRMTNFEKFIIAAFLLNAIDVVLTVFLIKGLGAIESNPAMAALLAIHPGFFATVKVAALVVVYWMLRRRYDESPEYVTRIAGGIVCVLAAICLWQTGLCIWMIQS